MFERFTDSSRHVVVLAQEKARQLNHGYIGTEHLLLGVLDVPDSVAARALTSLGVSPEAARQQVEVAVGTGPQPPAGHIPFTHRGKKALELALREALELRDQHIGTEHILLGLIRVGEGGALDVLANLGVDLADVRERVLELLSGAQHGAPPVEASQSGDQPRCPRCNAAAAENLRARTLPVSRDVGEGTDAVTVLWCGTCGAVVAVLRDEL